MAIMYEIYENGILALKERKKTGLFGNRYIYLIQEAENAFGVAENTIIFKNNQKTYFNYKNIGKQERNFNKITKKLAKKMFKKPLIKVLWTPHSLMIGNSIIPLEYSTNTSKIFVKSIHYDYKNKTLDVYDNQNNILYSCNLNGKTPQ